MFERCDDQRYCSRRQITSNFGYRILNPFLLFFITIASPIIFRTCKNDIQFTQASHRVLGFKIVMKYKCEMKFVDSYPLIGNAFEVNRRIVAGF